MNRFLIPVLTLGLLWFTPTYANEVLLSCEGSKGAPGTEPVSLEKEILLAADGSWIQPAEYAPNRFLRIESSSTAATWNFEVLAAAHSEFYELRSDRLTLSIRYWSLQEDEARAQLNCIESVGRLIEH
ncbi:MAG: hypothetical protein AAGI88_00135 [Pseudomonadota bacterium]